MTTHPKKFALITGCSIGGIGSALAEEFQAQGVHVFATARDLSKMSHLQHKPSITLLPLDVTSSESIAAALEAVKMTTGGKLDYLVNNSGTGYAMPVLDADLDESRRVYEVNVWGVMSMIQVFAPLVIAAEGTIVNVSSAAAHAATPYIGIYSASKSALEMISETLRLEMAPFNVKVMTVVTGRVNSNFFTANALHYLPPTSRYLAIKDNIAATVTGKTMPPGMSTQRYARGVVSDVLRGANGRVWRGAYATIAGTLLLFVPVFIVDAVVVFSSGLNNLRRKRTE